VAATHKTIVVVVSVAVALGGIMLGWLVYRGRKLGADSDPLAIAPLREKLWFDELYAATIGRAWVVLTIIWEQLNELMLFLRDLVVAMARWVSNLFSETGDRKLIDSLAFDGMCDTLRGVGRLAARTQHGFLPGYLRVIAFGAVALGLLVYLMK
jgi:NADH:ubiquinone oxidoreductase subunit 5 (subunit L)/multisubunit Na+/H+ antiporter MnhA subunit